MIKQKIFKYKFYNEIDELDFFVNYTNLNAFNGLINTEYNNFILFGPQNSGKSYLGKIWLNKNNAIKLKNNFQYIINNNQNVLIDNLTSFDQEKVFHIVNNCILNKLKILITSDKKINEINFQFKDLSSRLKTFNSFEISKPDDEMLLAILTKLLIDKQFIISSNDIFDYILKRVDRSYKGINEVVKKLDTLSLEKKRQLTIPLIKEIL